MNMKSINQLHFSTGIGAGELEAVVREVKPAADGKESRDVHGGDLYGVDDCCHVVFSFAGITDQGSFGYNVAVSIILFITLLFANFAEAIAEARGRHRLIVCEKRERRLRRR